MRRNSIFIPVLAAMMLCPGSAAGGTFLDLMTGTDVFVPDARGAAMGKTGASAATGAFTAGTNPALLSRAGGSQVMIGGAVLRLKETRAIPAFDSFDGFLVESVYVLNDDYQYGGGTGLVLQGLTDLPVELGFGVSYAPAWDFRYDYSEEVRDNDPFTQPRDQLIALNEVQSDGQIRAWTFGLGASKEWISAGMSVQLLSGDQDLLYRTWFVQDDSTEATRLAFDSLSGVRGVFGLAGRPSHRFQLGLTWFTETTLDGDSQQFGDVANLAFLGPPASAAETTGSLEIKYPHQLEFGVSFFPRARLRTAIQLEVAWTEWSKFQHSFYEETNLDNIWEGRVGIEHVFYNEMAARFGFLYQPSPRDDEIAIAAFTLGAGIDVGPFRADLALEVGNREYRYEDLFDDALFGDNTRIEKDRVEENTTSGLLTLTYALGHLGDVLQ